MIPYVEQEFNPNFIETMNRLSEVVTETESYLQKETAKAYDNLKIEEFSKRGKKIKTC